MPLHSIINHNSETQIYVWKIEESFEDLFDSVALNDFSLIRLNNMKSESHQKGFLAVRMLLQHCGYVDYDLFYHVSGKPFLKDGKHISISHSNLFSVIVVSNQNVGIDLEIVKDKVLRIASRFMDISHLDDLSREEQLIKATIIWGIKEAIFKLKNEIGISFPDHIFESPFSLDDKKSKATLRFNNQVESFRIFFETIENYVLVYAFEK
jgi:4'-phosphopantetheinyl transferase